MDHHHYRSYQQQQQQQYNRASARGGEWGDIVQQGPELTECSPQSDRRSAPGGGNNRDRGDRNRWTTTSPMLSKKDSTAAAAGGDDQRSIASSSIESGDDYSTNEHNPQQHFAGPSPRYIEQVHPHQQPQHQQSGGPPPAFIPYHHHHQPATVYAAAAPAYYYHPLPTSNSPHHGHPAYLIAAPTSHHHHHQPQNVGPAGPNHQAPAGHWIYAPAAALVPHQPPPPPHGGAGGYYAAGPPPPSAASSSGGGGGYYAAGPPPPPAASSSTTSSPIRRNFVVGPAAGMVPGQVQAQQAQAQIQAQHQQYNNYYDRSISSEIAAGARACGGGGGSGGVYQQGAADEDCNWLNRRRWSAASAGSDADPAESLHQHQQQMLLQQYHQRASGGSDGSAGGGGTTNRYHTGAKLERAHGRTPLFGERPSWWGQSQDQSGGGAAMAMDGEYNEMDSGLGGMHTGDGPCGQYSLLESPAEAGRVLTESVSDGECGGGPPGHNQPTARTGLGSVRSLAYVINGDDEEEEIVGRRGGPKGNNVNRAPAAAECKPPAEASGAAAAAAAAKESTAFTIEFTDEGSSTKITTFDRAQAEKNWKEQSAGRLHRNYVRRSMRKEEMAGKTTQQQQHSSPFRPPSLPQAAADAADGDKISSSHNNMKTYLLEKMLSSSPSPLRRPVSSRAVPAEAAATETETAASTNNSKSTTTEEVSGDVAAPIDPSSLLTVDSIGHNRHHRYPSGGDGACGAGRGHEDACSDAGTYILDRDEEFNEMMTTSTTKVIEEMEQEDRGDLTPVVTPRHRFRPPVRGHNRTDQEEADEEDEETDEADEDGSRQRKHLLLKELMRPAATTKKGSNGSKVVHSDPVKFRDTTIAAKMAAKQQQQSPAVAARSTTTSIQSPSKRSSLGAGAAAVGKASAVNRADPIRQSARYSTGGNTRPNNNSPAVVASKALPFNKAATSTWAFSKGHQAASKAAKEKEKEKEKEMMKNWLRRKEYNPMKAAQEAKKNHNKTTPPAAAAADADEPSFLSNRSRSFHLGAVISGGAFSGGALKKHPSVNDTAGLCFRTSGSEDEDEDEDEDEMVERGVVSESASSLDQASMQRLASLSQELGRRAKRVLSKVQKSSNSNYDPSSADGRQQRGQQASSGSSSRNNLVDKEAALADMLNELRVASRALEEVDRMLPDDQQKQKDSLSATRRAKITTSSATKMKTSSDTFEV